MVGAKLAEARSLPTLRMPRRPFLLASYWPDLVPTLPIIFVLPPIGEISRVAELHRHRSVCGNKMKNVAIIQARLGSTRLPAKVLRDVQGQTMLQRVVRQVRRCTFVDEIVVATSDENVDCPLVKFCQDNDLDVFVGSRLDVVKRITEAAKKLKADNIISLGAHCPLIDPGVIDQVVIKLINDSFLDFTTNVYPTRMYPIGLDVSAFTLKTLLLVDRLAFAPAERENPLLHVFRNPGLFSIGNVQPREDHSHLRWSVETMDDLRLVNAIYKHFGPRRIRWRNIVDAYQSNPHWAAINSFKPQQRVA